VIYFLTAAVERTPVHEGLWVNMLAYAELLEAKVLVKPVTYRNPSAEFEPGEWDAAFEGYFSSEQVRLNSNCIWAGNVGVVPTASNPLSGLQLHGKHASVIFPHTRQHLRSYPGGNSDYAKMHWTTGAVTVPSYSDTKLGAKAVDHHIHGFIIVEVEDDKLFHVRNVNACSKTGAFVDSGRGWFADGGITMAPPVQALRIGDSHAHEQYEPVIAAVAELRDMAEPERIIMDDVYSHSVAGHRLERDSWRHAIRKRRSNKTVQDELTEAFELMRRLACTDGMHSNHHDQLDEWLDNVDGRTDPDNLATWGALLTKSAGAYGNVPAIELASLGHAWNGRPPKFWRRGQRCIIGDVRHDHGHEGFGGSRGSEGQWFKAGCKVTTAHTHKSFIRDGHVQVGHTSDPAEHHYADPTKSAWAWSVCVQDHLGKRQLIHFISDGETARWLLEEA